METAEKIQECPVTACMELQEAWKSGKGAFDANSKWCQKCLEEEPETANICRDRTVSVKEAAKKEAKVVARKMEKTPRKMGPRGNSTVYGHGLSRQSGILDVELLRGATVAKMMAACNGDAQRVKSHIGHLQKEHGVKIRFVGGIYKIEKGAS